MNKYFLIVALMLPALANATEYTTSNVVVYDGDTFKADVHVFPNMIYNGSIRIRGIDTPETRTKSACEKRLGVLAKIALAELFNNHGVRISNVKNGKYAGRVIADVAAGPISVSEYMIEQGYAKPYDGGKRDRNWCKD